MTVSNLQHTRQRNLGTYQPRQLAKQLRQQAEVMRDQLLSAANVIDGLCEKVEAADNAARMAGTTTASEDKPSNEVISAKHEMLLRRDDAWTKAIGEVIGYDEERCGSQTPVGMAALVRGSLNLAAARMAGKEQRPCANAEPQPS
jgi:hypothetical protein